MCATYVDPDALLTLTQLENLVLWASNDIKSSHERGVSTEEHDTLPLVGYIPVQPQRLCHAPSPVPYFLAVPWRSKGESYVCSRQRTAARRRQTSNS